MLYRCQNAILIGRLKVSRYVGFVSARSRYLVRGVSPLRQRPFPFVSTLPYASIQDGLQSLPKGSAAHLHSLNRELRKRSARKTPTAPEQDMWGKARASTCLTALTSCSTIRPSEANRSGVFLISGMRNDQLYLLPSSWYGADRNQQHCRYSRTHADVIWNSTFNVFEGAVRELVRSTYRLQLSDSHMRLE